MEPSFPPEQQRASDQSGSPGILYATFILFTRQSAQIDSAIFQTRQVDSSARRGATLDEDIATPACDLRGLCAALTLARGHDLSKVQARHMSTLRGRGTIPISINDPQNIRPKSGLKDRPAARLQLPS